MRWLQTEGDDASGRGGWKCLPARRKKCLLIEDYMVGRKNKDDCVGIASRDQVRGGGNSGTGISPRRLKHNLGVDAELAQLLGNDEAKL
jgi:hypothetical protein